MKQMKLKRVSGSIVAARQWQLVVVVWSEALALPRRLGGWVAKSWARGCFLFYSNLKIDPGTEQVTTTMTPKLVAILRMRGAELTRFVGLFVARILDPSGRRHGDCATEEKS
jgi:hypothetical protein